MRTEVSTKMVIPETINVGFQKREDTYTKKLAYVVYTDAKGVLRKEQSWNSWRDNKIKPLDFKNEPTEGFVLNRNVGGHKSGWNHRNAYIRIYDPRDFEFEISLENLLFILQETSSIKGKGLEGEFVYAWHGKDLVLLPVGTEEYKACENFTKKQTQKVGKGDLIEGHIYLLKDMTQVMYLGKHPYAEKKGYSERTRYKPVGNRHIFYKIGEKETTYTSKYLALPGLTKVAERTSTEVSPEYAKNYTAYKKSDYCKAATGVKIVKKAISKKDLDSAYYYGMHIILKEDGKDILYAVKRKYSWSYSYGHEYQLFKGPEVNPVLVSGTFPVPKIDTNKDPTFSYAERTVLDLSAYSLVLTTDKGEDFDILRDSKY